MQTEPSQLVPSLTGPVYTIDGHRLGTAAEVKGRYLRLQRRFRRDLWVALDSILPSPWDGRTVTRFGFDVLDRYCVTTAARLR